MKTLEIVVMIWTLIINLYGLISNIKGMGIMGVLVFKFLCLISFIYFGYNLLMMIP
jgi:hypothetical protein